MVRALPRLVDELFPVPVAEPRPAENAPTEKAPVVNGSPELCWRPDRRLPVVGAERLAPAAPVEALVRS